MDSKLLPVINHETWTSIIPTNQPTKQPTNLPTNQSTPNSEVPMLSPNFYQSSTMNHLDLPQQFPDLEKLLNWTSLDFLKTAAPPAAAPPPPPGPPVTSSSIELPFGQLKTRQNNLYFENTNYWCIPDG